MEQPLVIETKGILVGVLENFRMTKLVGALARRAETSNVVVVVLENSMSNVKLKAVDANGTMAPAAASDPSNWNHNVATVVATEVADYFLSSPSGSLGGLGAACSSRGLAALLR